MKSRSSAASEEIRIPSPGTERQRQNQVEDPSTFAAAFSELKWTTAHLPTKPCGCYHSTGVSLLSNQS